MEQRRSEEAAAKVYARACSGVVDGPLLWWQMGADAFARGKSKHKDRDVM